MKAILRTAIAALGLPVLAFATDFDVSVQSGGSNVVYAAVGGNVDYQVVGELSDAANEGLAGFVCNLKFTGGPLVQADAPSANPMMSFDRPAGITNPQGFGGAVVGGKLVQVGGMQNTIKHTFPGFPNGTVITGVAQPGAPQALVEGSLTAPLAAGTYTLEAHRIGANVIRQGETGTPFWAVEQAMPGTVTNLTVIVLDCAATSYCTGKLNSQGCVPAVASTGTPTASGGADDFHVTCSNVVDGVPGLLFWGKAPAATPFNGGTLCVQPTLVRTPRQNSGGAGSCAGTFDYHLTQAYMAVNGIVAGDTVYAQFYYRDAAHVDGTMVGLSDALQFEVCP